MQRLILLATLLLTALAGCISDDGPLPSEGSNEEGDTPLPMAANATGVVQEESASWVAGVSGCGGVFLAELAGTDHAEIIVRPEAQGIPFNASFTSTAPSVEVGVSFFAGTGFLETFSAMGAEVEGVVPDGADAAILWSCLGAEVTAQFIAGA